MMMFLTTEVLAYQLATTPKLLVHQLQSSLTEAIRPGLWFPWQQNKGIFVQESTLHTSSKPMVH